MMVDDEMMIVDDNDDCNDDMIRYDTILRLLRTMQVWFVGLFTP